jgi:predicted RNase H-like nuclease (RuvC/YqgF family)
MTPEQDAELNSLLSEFGNDCDKQALNEAVGTSYDADPQSSRASIVAYVESLLAEKDAEIERLKHENATLKEALRVKDTGYAYETPEMKALRQKHIEDNERAMAEELLRNQQYERSIKDRHRAFREEYTRLEHEELSRLTESKKVLCPTCKGRGMRWNVDAGFQCQRCEGTGQIDGGES